MDVITLKDHLDHNGRLRKAGELYDNPRPDAAIRDGVVKQAPQVRVKPRKPKNRQVRADDDKAENPGPSKNSTADNKGRSKSN